MPLSSNVTALARFATLVTIDGVLCFYSEDCFLKQANSPLQHLTSLCPCGRCWTQFTIQYAGHRLLSHSVAVFYRMGLDVDLSLIRAAQFRLFLG